MKGELIQITTEDQLILQGFYCSTIDKSTSKACIIHIHGSYGNFYENFFLTEMSKQFTKNGFSFLSVGTRGRDYYSDFKIRKENKYESVRIGGIREIFQQCEIDIKSWVSYVKSLGYSKIILQGHSLGAMKVIYYYSRSQISVNGIILISPPDHFGLHYA
ncbi:MAG: alpha/beta fold hydrolase, partial [Candidatus Magasanikiibacteriota bacterium]